MLLEVVNNIADVKDKCHEQAIEGMVADVSKGKTLEGDST
jgi:hypothetical protein